jgi:hypothetical protein
VVALYVTIDDLFGPRVGPGRRLELSDAELICLAVAQVLLGCASERRWLRFARRRLGMALQHLARHAPSWWDQRRLLDSTALPCGQSRGTVKRSALWDIAAYGYCKSPSGTQSRRSGGSRNGWSRSPRRKL